MNTNTERKRILITVKTYPHPSLKHDELVCTAGITGNGQWIRLYPVDYHNLQECRRYKKYQWIEVEVEPSGAANDQRKESRKPRLNTLKVVSDVLDTGNKWRARREVIDPLPHHTLNELSRLHESERVSLGIVRPSKILDLKITSAEPNWDPKYECIYSQLRLFDEPHRRLEKIPYSFKYIFECEDNNKPHTATLTDWEAGVLFLNQRERLGSEKEAAESVRDKFLGEICNPSRDTRFFVGTFHLYSTWLVLGTFWPPKDPQGRLF